MWPNPQFPADLVTFTEEILYGKLQFFCSVSMSVLNLYRCVATDGPGNSISSVYSITTVFLFYTIL